MVRRLLVALAVVALPTVIVSSPGPVRADSNEGQPGLRQGAASAITAGNHHTCAVLSGGFVKCWGYNGDGELGQGSTDNLGDNPLEMGAHLPTVDLGTSRTATAVSAGSNFTCALLDNGTVKCWGYNAEGELGQGSIADLGDQINEMGDHLPAIDLGTGRKATSISAGASHACALLDDGSVKCWGNNIFGQLGQGSIAILGDQSNEMGDHLPPVDLGTGRTATAISAGTNHTCALLDNGTVKCWGVNTDGELGQGSTAWVGDQPNEMGDHLPPVDLGTGRTAIAITAGGNHTCASLDNATLKCWGQNSRGELGQGSTASLGDQPNEMGDHLVPVALGTGRAATAVSAGGTFTCALLDNGTDKCWGNDNEGQSGQNSTTRYGDQPNEMGDFLPAINLGVGRTATAITTGFTESCALLDDASIKCWGFGTYGELGQENMQQLGDQPGEMAALASISLGGGTSGLVVPAPVAPAAPVGVSGTAGVQSVALSWTAPTDNGGAAVTGYRVETSTDDGLHWTRTISDTATTATTKTIDNLTAGQAIRFRVSALNGKGASPASLPSTALTPAAPALPPGLQYTALNPARILDTRVDGATVDNQFHTGVKLAAGQEIALQVAGRGGVPANSTAVVLNVTVTDPEAAGYLTVYPCGTTAPNASNLNYTAGETIPNAVVVKLSAAGTVCFHTQQTTNLLADVNGAIT
ncbi:MAG: hypothetical protein JWN39_3636 [Ilumatobacteraceae bacterium]|nr:hypothetical protein [Ilumatobacteraceae bacterium]